SRCTGTRTTGFPLIPTFSPAGGEGVYAGARRASVFSDLVPMLCEGTFDQPAGRRVFLLFPRRAWERPDRPLRGRRSPSTAPDLTGCPAELPRGPAWFPCSGAREM